MPGQAEEEVNQLTYMQKHMPSLLSLLAETTEEGENSTKVSSSIINYPLSWTMLLSMASVNVTLLQQIPVILLMLSVKYFMSRYSLFISSN